MKWKIPGRLAGVCLALLLVVAFIACSDDEAIPFKGSLAYLRSLESSVGEINFDPSILEYDVYLGSDNASVTLTVEGFTGNEEITINGDSVTDGQYEFTDLDYSSSEVGQAKITVAQAGKKSNQYSVLFYNFDQDARLASIESDDVNLNIPFLPARKKGYSVKTGKTSITLIFTATHPGATITVGGVPAPNGAPFTIAFPDNGDYDKEIVVTSEDGAKKTVYEFKCTYEWVPDYVTTNYDFDGGIQAFINGLTYHAANGPDWNGSVTVTGVVTCTKVYMHGDGNKSFFIQDKDRGLAVFTSNPPEGVEVGNKIEITLTKGKFYYKMPEATDFDKNSVVVLSKRNNLYYQTGDYAKEEVLGNFFMYDGMVKDAMDGNRVGRFADNDNWSFHGETGQSWSKYLEESAEGQFYGPINLSFDRYRIEISSEGQIKPR